MLKKRAIGNIQRLQRIGVALDKCHLRIIGNIQTFQLAVEAVNPLELRIRREIEVGKKIARAPHTMKVLVVRKIHGRDGVVLAPQTLQCREKLHALKGRNALPLAVDVDNPRDLRRVQRTAAVAVVLPRGNHLAELRVRKIVLVNRNGLRPVSVRNVGRTAKNHYRRQKARDNPAQKPI